MPNTTTRVSNPEAAIGEIFLSPRVVDQRSFEEYSSLLRELIREASGQSASLAATTGDIRTLSEAALGAAGAIQKRVEAGAALGAQLDRRFGELAELLRSAADPKAVAERLNASLSEAVEARVEQIGQRLTLLAEAAVMRVTEARAGLAGAAEDAAARVRVESERLDSAHAALAERARELEQELAQRLCVAEERVNTLLSGAEGRLSAATTRAEEAVGALESRVAAARRDVEQIGSMDLSALDRLVAAAAGIVGDPAAPAPASLADLVQRGEQVLDGAAMALSQLGDISRRAEEAREPLGPALAALHEAVHACGRAESLLRERIAGAREAAVLVENAAEPVRLSAAALSESTDRAALARAGLEEALGLAGEASRRVGEVRDAGKELEARETQLRVLLEMPLSPLRQQMDQIAAWLTQAMARAHETIQRLEAAGRR